MFVNNGNLVERPGRQSEIIYEVALNSLEIMGCSAVNVGGNDLLLSLKWIQYVKGKVDVPLISANIEQDGENLFEPYIIKSYQVAGNLTRVAIIGVVSTSYQETVSKVNPKIIIKEPAKALEKCFQELSKEQLDYVILLASAGGDESKHLAQQFSIINLIVYTSEKYISPIHSQGNCLFVKPYKNGKYVDVIDVFEEAHTGQPKYKNYQLAASYKIPDHPVVAQILDVYQKMVSYERLIDEERTIEKTSAVKYVGSASCQSCHPQIYEIWQSSDHARAYNKLKINQQHLNPRCVICHTIGFSLPTGFVDYSVTPQLANVGCESCHGPGNNHLQQPKLYYQQLFTCKQCHTEENSPNFNYREYISRIKHW